MAMKNEGDYIYIVTFWKKCASRLIFGSVILERRRKFKIFTA